MKFSRKSTVFSASTTTTTATTTTEIPTTVHHTPRLQWQAAARIQSHYRAHLVRTLYKKISFVNSEANSLQKLIQRQETVDAVRSEEREKLRMNEALMGLLLRLDSVPGVDPTVREARRKVSRRIVGLQEILDGICEAKLECDEVEYYNFDKVVEQMEEQVCEERGGGEEMERFCAHYLGLRCLQRFLRE
ncbi:hypothetical protein Ddye_012793 [Dipteronia dyeriana]|uniref:BAG domain-containing protein n=1 Tax=Dipteronia dyeriana TaxID=168575 RepID=A0AAD9X580_9ROSI|nr:hypothetical protein Ddye_012793 [Dipteronia dyeriana]